MTIPMRRHGRTTWTLAPVLAVGSVVLASGCSDSSDPVGPSPDPPESTALAPGMQILENGSVEQASTAWSTHLAGVLHTAELTTADAAQGFTSMKITSQGHHGDSFSYWSQIIEVDVEDPVQLRLDLQMRLEGIEGRGIHFVVRGDDKLAFENPPAAFASTELEGREYVGTSGWQPVSLDVLDVTSDVRFLRVYLILAPQTRGTVYFDDVSLTVVAPPASSGTG